MNKKERNAVSKRIKDIFKQQQHIIEIIFKKYEKANHSHQDMEEQKHSRSQYSVKWAKSRALYI